MTTTEAIIVEAAEKYHKAYLPEMCRVMILSVHIYANEIQVMYIV